MVDFLLQKLYTLKKLLAMRNQQSVHEEIVEMFSGLSDKESSSNFNKFSKEEPDQPGGVQFSPSLTYLENGEGMTYCPENKGGFMFPQH